MENPLHEFERATGLTVSQAAKFLAIPRPTYYQYRRSGEMPPVVVRFISVVVHLPKTKIADLIQEYVDGDTL